jgi:sulfide:quinone oxidoreductase
MKKGRWVHWAKVAFEKYYLFKMKRGSADPLYEQLFLKLLGVNKTK